MTARKSPAQGELGLNLSPMPELLRNNDLIAFGRVTNDYYLGAQRAEYADITEDMVREISPDILQQSLFSEKSPNSVDGVVFSAAEHERVVRFPNSYKTTVVNNTFTSRGLDHDMGRRNQRADKQGIEALADRLEPMGRTLDGIRREQDTIEKLRKAASHAGWAHIPAQDMLIATTYIDLIAFGRILEVVGHENGWDEKKATQARRSLDVRLYLGIGDGDLGLTSRVGNWEGMLDLAHKYGAVREKIFANRIKRVSLIVGKYTVVHSND
jgi:hypothetical protein